MNSGITKRKNISIITLNPLDIASIKLTTISSIILSNGVSAAVAAEIFKVYNKFSCVEF